MAPHPTAEEQAEEIIRRWRADPSIDLAAGIGPQDIVEFIDATKPLPVNMSRAGQAIAE